MPKTLPRLGLLSLLFLVVANMIGTGIYTTTGFLVEGVPSAWISIFLWGVGGIAALGGAFAYVAVAQLYPYSGGEYTFLSKLYHPSLGFIAGLVSLVVGFAAPTAAALVTLAAYFPYKLPVAQPEKTFALLVLGGLTGVHLLGLHTSARVQNLFVLIKLGLLAVLTLGGLLASGKVESFDAQGPVQATQMASGLIYIAFAYSGWNAAVYILQEVKDPHRLIPRALIGGTVLIMALYVGFNLALFRHLSLSELRGVKEVGHLLAQKLWGAPAAQVLSIGISLALVSSASAMLMIAPRVTTTMGENLRKLHFLRHRNAFYAPTYGILLQSLLAMVFILVPTLDQLLNYIGFTLTLFGFLVVVGLALRHPTHFPKGMAGVAAGIFLLLSLWMMVSNFFARPWESLASLITMASIGTLYFWLR
ncbi:MAG: APC family permease [Bacteroidia bacterium]